MGNKYPDCDFMGYVTRNDVQCSDGRTIRRNAFKAQDGEKVPLVWNHDHDDIRQYLGHTYLENRRDGVFGYSYFNDTETGQYARELVEHGDIVAMSIYANKLKQSPAMDVLHGEIKEVSLVMAGANPGAYIETVIQHGEEIDGSAIIFSGENLTLCHHETNKQEGNMKKGKRYIYDEEIYHEDEDDELEDEYDEDEDDEEDTILEALAELDDDQLEAVYAAIGMAIESAQAEMEDDEYDEEEDDEYDEEDMAMSDDYDYEEEYALKHNAFDQTGGYYAAENPADTLSHEEMAEIFEDAKRSGSLKDAVLAHADEQPTYGIKDIDYLFPDARNINIPPAFIQRDMGWVQKVMTAVHHTPFSRIKSMFADITEDEARARGYIKGKLKKEEVFSLLKRSTTPTTIYKKQKLDRDDVIDITDFDVVAWLKAEMRMMLDEEIARAILLGDGRLASSDDKINEQCIRPIATDAELYTVKVQVPVSAGMTADEKAKAMIRAAIKARKEYKGTGNPVLYTTEDVLTDCLLLEDKVGRVIYDSVEKLRTTLRVSDIVTVPVMEGYKVDEQPVLGVIVNLADYSVGADKGGAVNMFDDFDIDYNAQKYLIETRCSGALTKPKSAMLLVESTSTASDVG